MFIQKKIVIYNRIIFSLKTSKKKSQFKIALEMITFIVCNHCEDKIGISRLYEYNFEPF